MSKYVDADYINDFFDKWEEEVRNPEPLTFSIVQNVRSVLNEAPTIDIVRCKDCMLNTINTDGTTLNWCYKFGYAVEDTDFCSYGERKEE